MPRRSTYRMSVGSRICPRDELDRHVVGASGHDHRLEVGLDKSILRYHRRDAEPFRVVSVVHPHANPVAHGCFRLPSPSIGREREASSRTAIRRGLRPGRGQFDRPVRG